jgi:hypothetical protein
MTLRCTRRVPNDKHERPRSVHWAEKYIILLVCFTTKHRRIFIPGTKMDAGGGKGCKGDQSLVSLCPRLFPQTLNRWSQGIRAPHKTPPRRKLYRHQLCHTCRAMPPKAQLSSLLCRGHSGSHSHRGRSPATSRLCALSFAQATTARDLPRQARALHWG